MALDILGVELQKTQPDIIQTNINTRGMSSTFLAVRANQRDVYHVSSLRDQTDTVLRSWLGTRWLTRWDKEVGMFVKLLYYGLTTGRATQTLGEEYTDIWQYSIFNKSTPPSPLARAVLVLLSVVPTYLLGKWGNALNNASHPERAKWFKAIPTALEVAAELNLAFFYLRGTYYDPVKRLMGIQHISSFREDPHTRPPSYSLLGVLIGVRLLYRLKQNLPSLASPRDANVDVETPENQDIFLDEDRISSFLTREHPESEPARPAEEDERTALDFAAIPGGIRASRNCTLCLEERTDSCVTECGHLFCWSCIVGWGREKAECPLCRQSLVLSRLLPIHNL